MSQSKPHVLVAGVTGIAGSYISKQLLASGYRVSGLARRLPAEPIDGVHYLQADLDDIASLRDAIADGTRYTHLVYSGFASREGVSWSEVSAWNSTLFRNLIDWATTALPNLERVLLMQGQKYYGSHLGPYRTPSRESDSRHDGENFYFDQQDDLAEAAAGNGWSWVALRPHIVCGLNLRASMNPLVLIGAYASICKALGQPLTFPGKPAAYDTLYQATDADLLGRAGAWSLFADSAANQAYNITNGDLYRWRHVWELLADKLDMPLAEPAQQSLAPFSVEHAGLWSQLAQSQNLLEADIHKLGDWTFANYIISCDWDIAASTVKARLHGFNDCRDSLEMWATRFDEMQHSRILPRF